ncbi:CubicO group peptidase (beta-lactamase class C family) [Paenibacillus endophyticus]|uniref:CubicO group peptidase (Beta-lactamase class C family) n=1 Tax=Paenibacillus endophyticus TaxID=1294268 RepID=A0A7W5C6A4_9BACL|nr:serine hydrolase [Paenibacillus endophyticus]MBB3151967.1 CubicO group peptidase (beta-lactamase class C family) [Paenibacillus endophyticus]
MHANELKLEHHFLAERKIKSVIVRQGTRSILEWHASGKDIIGPLYSCTKSVLSLLIGMAIDQGLLKNVDQPITDFLDHPAEIKEALSRITIKHLLTMTSGFDWPDFDKPYKAFRASEDPVQYVFKQPLISDPGTAFAYNSGGSHLLSAILTKAAGISALSFAKEHLFEPLGFQGARWMERGGVNEGGTGLFLYSRDLANIGSLLVQNGCYGGKSFVSSEWITESTQLHHRGLLHYEPPIYGGYGYHWWHSPEEHNSQCDCYFAFGHGGQYLLIAPEYELTVVVRKQITKRNEAEWSRKLIFEQIIPVWSGKKRNREHSELLKD